MRRRLSILAVVLVLLAAAGAAGWFALRMVPEQLRRQTERLIGDATGAEVKLGELHLALRLYPWVRLEARGNRVDISAPAARVAVGSVSTSLDPLALLRGQVKPHHVRLEGVRADFAGNAALQAPAAADAAQPPNAARLLAILESTAATLRERRGAATSPGQLAGVALEAVDLSVWLNRGAAQPALPLLREGAARLSFSADSRRGDLLLTGQCATQAEGATAVADAAGAKSAAGTALRFEMHAEQSEVGARLSLAESDLGALFEFAANFGAFNPGAAALAEKIRSALPLRGRAGFALNWRAPELGPQRFELAMDGHALRGPIGAGAESAAPLLVLKLHRPQLRLDLAVAEDALELHAAEFSDGGLALRATGRAALPFAGDAPLRAEVSTGRLSRASLEHAAAQLGGALRGRAEDALNRLASGELRQLRLTLQSSAAGLDEIAARGPLARPGELQLSMRFARLALRGASAGGGRGASGALLFDGERLTLRGFTLPAQAQKKSLRLDAELSGLSELRDLSQLRCLRPPSVPGLPGIAPLRAWQWSRRPVPYVPRWQQLNLQLDWFAHPAFFCTGRNIAITIKPVPEHARVEFALLSGRWAGLPIEASGSFREDKNQRRMQVSAVLHPRGAAAAAAQGAPAAAQGNDATLAQALAAGGPWSRGQFDLQAERMGFWRISGARGTARAQGSTLHLEQTQIDLAPGGPVEIYIALELDEPQPPRYRAALSLAGTDLSKLWQAAGQERILLSGSLHGALTLQSRLVLGQGVLYGADGTASLQARAGKIHRRMPLLLAIAGHRFNPFGDRDRLPYRAVDLVGLLRGGDLQVNVLSLAGPNLRAAAQGRAQLSKPWEIKGVMGVFFFPLLDNLIELIPLLNRVILGKNGNLVGAYFALDGTLPAPRARLVPGRSLVEGPPGSVLMSIPNFIADGIRGIQSIMQPRSRSNGGKAKANAKREES